MVIGPVDEKGGRDQVQVHLPHLGGSVRSLAVREKALGDGCDPHGAERVVPTPRSHGAFEKPWNRCEIVEKNSAEIWVMTHNERFDGSIRWSFSISAGPC